MDFATFFYPGFYRCPKRDAAAGSDLDEWAIVRANARSVFVDTQQIVPALGYTDASLPAVLAYEAELALAHGVDAFIFNYYHDGQTEELEQPLENFQILNTQLRFAVNICCHMPKRKLPFGLSDRNVAPWVQLTTEQFTALGRSFAHRFFQKPKYLRRSGRPVVTFYHVGAMLLMYGPDGLASRISAFRQAARDLGIELNLIGLFSVMGGWERIPVGTWELPFDGYSCYITLPDFEGEEPVQSFPALADRWLGRMRKVGSPNCKPIVACVGAGWNATARGSPGYDPATHGLAFPYYPVVVDDSPEAFESYLGAAARLSRANPSVTNDLLFLGPWNEWSEGCFLLPDTRFGLGRLHAVRRVKESLTADERLEAEPDEGRG